LTKTAAHGLAALDRARVLHVPDGDTDANTEDRTYLVLAKPNERTSPDLRQVSYVPSALPFLA
jgi:hypothetical protein